MLRRLVQFKKPVLIDTLGAEQLENAPWNFFKGPLLRFSGGYIKYNFNYRSFIDTPFTEQDISQHNISGSVNFSLGSRLPFAANFWVRRTNSLYYRNITDVQVNFNAASFREGFVEETRRKLLKLRPSVKDSLLSELYKTKLAEWSGLTEWLTSAFTAQRIREYREVLLFSGTGTATQTGDSLNAGGIDSLHLVASAYVAMYDSTVKSYDELTKTIGVLQKQLATVQQRWRQFRQLLNGKIGDWQSYEKWQEEVRELKPSEAEIPDKFKWLMGVRNFSLGKSPVNYSDLTAKNIGITGINFEYNTKFYFAIAAGLLDYRFRDFSTTTAVKNSQYMYNVRVGLGRLERNYIILSVLGGKKQLFASLPGSANKGSVSFTTISLESKWQLNRYTWLVGEVAQSLAPDFRSSPPRKAGSFAIDDKTSKAFSARLFTAVPKWGTRIEGLYRYIGANYQSFSSFQSNSTLATWTVRWDQDFFKRRFRISSSLRSNEFSNPYLLQNYRANTVFKSINASLRIRKWPAISIGYTPMSQLTVVDQQVVENRFQTMTANVSHFYRIGAKSAISSLVYNRFYNTARDTGFIYFNSTNMYFSQSILFQLFTMNAGVSVTTNSQYRLNVLACNLKVPLLKNSYVMCGLKINNLNERKSKTGIQVGTGLRFSPKDFIDINYEQSYLPGNSSILILNRMGMIQYSRYF